MNSKQKALTASHEIRREEVAEAAARLVSRAGLEKVTVREVALELGYSTTIVSHYFKSKKDLLLYTYQNAARRSAARFEAVRKSSPSDIQAYLETILPMDDESRRDWKVWLAFQGMAIGDPDFSAEQRRQVLDARRNIRIVLEALNLAAKRGPELAARDLLTAAMGISVQATFDPEDWPTDRIRAALAHVINDCSN